MTQDPLSLIKTPNKWHTLPIRIRPNIPALISPNIQLLKFSHLYAKQSITSQTARNIKEPLHLQQYPPTPNEDNTRLISDISYSPSLKTQKKQYLKLFTTASTNRQESIISNQSVCDSNQSSIKQQLPSFNSQKQDDSQKNLIILGKTLPRRRLFSDSEIENEQKIIMEQINGQSCINFKEFLMTMPRLASSMSLRPSTEQGVDTQQLFQICSGCFKFIPNDTTHHHQAHCCKFKTFLSMNPNERLAFIRSAGLQLMHRIEQQAGGLQSGDLVSLIGHCTAFLKECELAWSTGRPSQIYNFKLKELQASSAKLVRCVQDILRLNFLLALQQTHTHQQPLIQ